MLHAIPCILEFKNEAHSGVVGDGEKNRSAFDRVISAPVSVCQPGKSRGQLNGFLQSAVFLESVLKGPRRAKRQVQSVWMGRQSCLERCTWHVARVTWGNSATDKRWEAEMRRCRLALRKGGRRGRFPPSARTESHHHPLSALAPRTRLKRRPTTAPPLRQTARSPTSASPRRRKGGRAARLPFAASAALLSFPVSPPYSWRRLSLLDKERRNESGRSEREGGGSPWFGDGCGEAALRLESSLPGGTWPLPRCWGGFYRG